MARANCWYCLRKQIATKKNVLIFLNKKKNTAILQNHLLKEKKHIVARIFKNLLLKLMLLHICIP
jgi:hypothetical protein